ncbi:hypothetical protein NDU88_000249 [Pleurodeles waltl]|uniref:Uncharacterized protein n=1 Tax=Pleurodeles waltl TaxID=8319 RepID=A0AAV7KPS8_PLEWA|nr:hypothetical protein NDU88_000249 [Pleurodeles waltl]
MSAIMLAAAPSAPTPLTSCKDCQSDITKAQRLALTSRYRLLFGSASALANNNNTPPALLFRSQPKAE